MLAFCRITEFTCYSCLDGQCTVQPLPEGPFSTPGYPNDYPSDTALCWQADAPVGETVKMGNTQTI